MGSPKFSTMLIAAIFVSMLATILALTMAEFSENYDVDSNNESIAIISQLGTLNRTAINISDKMIKEDKEETSAFDILGQIFDSGYQSIKVVAGSFDVLNSMINAGFNKLGVSTALPIIKTAILSALLILIAVGIIISVVVRKDV